MMAGGPRFKHRRGRERRPKSRAHGWCARRGKANYRRHEAEAIARHVRRGGDRHFVPFPCVCGWWHLGHLPEGLPHAAHEPYERRKMTESLPPFHPVNGVEYDDELLDTGELPDLADDEWAEWVLRRMVRARERLFAASEKRSHWVRQIEEW